MINCPILPGLFGLQCVLRVSGGAFCFVGALDVADLRFRRDGAGVEVMLDRSKTDQQGRGQTKEIARGRRASTCPVTALRDWLELAETERGRCSVL